MIILGATADDKGAQLEALVAAVLTQQGYVHVRRNLVAAGGNEIDVSAVRESPVLSRTQSTPVMCEAKAYAGPLNTPTWHKFLGKLHLARAENNTTVGILVALSGVNGNVAGSHAQLSKVDPAVFIIEGREVEESALSRGELLPALTVRDVLFGRVNRAPSRLDIAFYGGVFYWISRWEDDSYSVLNGHAEALSTQQLTDLTPALEASLAGTLLSSEAEQTEREARHALLVGVLNDLFHGDVVEQAAESSALRETTATLATLPFCAVEGERLRLLRPEELTGEGVSSLFTTLFAQEISVDQLEFIKNELHTPYVDRLVGELSVVQKGFTLDAAGEQTLRAIAPFFPSLWIFLTQPFPLITTDRDENAEVSDELRAADRNNFWAELSRIARDDYVNPALRGLLYDYLGLAEIETQTEVVIKSKTSRIGAMRSAVRDAVRQMDLAEFDGEGVTHIPIRMMPNAGEPWEDAHPEPADRLRADS